MILFVLYDDYVHENGLICHTDHLGNLTFSLF
jgi:hypothetical protein